MEVETFDSKQATTTTTKSLSKLKHFAKILTHVIAFQTQVL